MRSLFWRIFASFWLAIALVAGLSMLLGRMLNQDAWLLSQHPGMDDLAETWTQRYEKKGPRAAQNLLEQRKRKFRIDVQAPSRRVRRLLKPVTAMKSACPGAV